MLHHYYHKIKGWFDFQDLYTMMVNKYPSGSRFVEIGCYKGRSSVFMGVEIINSGKDIKLDCIDSWEFKGSEYVGTEEYSDCDTAFAEFKHNILPLVPTIGFRKMSSVEASKQYEDQSLDFIFIDGSHKYEEVKNDILAWYPKLKYGGTLAGHDRDFPGVDKAVKELFCTCEIEKVGNGCWLHNKSY